MLQINKAGFSRIGLVQVVSCASEPTPREPYSQLVLHFLFQGLVLYNCKGSCLQNTVDKLPCYTIIIVSICIVKTG